jgi:hypothetical protein
MAALGAFPIALITLGANISGELAFIAVATEGTGKSCCCHIMYLLF